MREHNGPSGVLTGSAMGKTSQEDLGGDVDEAPQPGIYEEAPSARVLRKAKLNGRSQLQRLMDTASLNADTYERNLNSSARLRDALSMLDAMLPKEMTEAQDEALALVLERISPY